MYVQFHPISEITYKLRHGVFFFRERPCFLKATWEFWWTLIELNDTPPAVISNRQMPPFPATQSHTCVDKTTFTLVYVNAFNRSFCSRLIDRVHL